MAQSNLSRARCLFGTVRRRRDHGTDLVRVTGIFETPHRTVTTVAAIGGHGPQVAREVPRQDVFRRPLGQTHIRVSFPEINWRRARRNIVMGDVTVGAGDVAMDVGRCSPVGCQIG